MKYNLLELLVCPECKSQLYLKDPEEENDEIKSGKLDCTACGRKYNIAEYIPRFVETDQYVGNFSFEWDIHRQTQIDLDGESLSHNVFMKKKHGFSIPKKTWFRKELKDFMWHQLLSLCFW